MATEYVNIQGKVKWFRHQTPNEWGKWSHVMYPTNESLETIRELQARGMRNVLQKDDDGYRVTWSRPTSKEIRGKVVGFAPPEIFFADGVTPMKNVPIGNGSDVTTKLEVYKFGDGKRIAKGLAARWLSSKIEHLVPFESDRDFTRGEERAAEGLAEATPQRPFV